MMILLLSVLNAKAFNYQKIIKNNKGVSEYQKGNYKEAEKNFLDNSVKNPKDPYLHFNLGNAYYKNKEYDKAESEYKYALQNPDFKDKSSVYQNLGNIFYSKKEYKKALENYRKALLENPNNSDARHNYEVVKRLLMKQQKQKNKNKKQNKKNKNKKDKKDKQKQQNKKQQDKKQEDKQKQQQQKKDQKKKDQKKKQEQQKKLKKEKKKKEIDKILKALMKKEKAKRKEKQTPVELPQKGKYW